MLLRPAKLVGTKVVGLGCASVGTTDGSPGGRKVVGRKFVGSSVGPSAVDRPVGFRVGRFAGRALGTGVGLLSNSFQTLDYRLVQKFVPDLARTMIPSWTLRESFLPRNGPHCIVGLELSTDDDPLDASCVGR